MNSSFDGSSSRLTRRGFVAQGSMTLACAAVSPYGRAFADSGVSDVVEVGPMFGRIRGLKTGNLTTFKGIPYTGSVSGPNRFKAAPPLQPWTGVREAFQLGAPSYQAGEGRPTEPPPDENCLFLNVWTPATDGHKRPVMFYNHGGGFTDGSAGAAYQDGGNMARTWDVVVVATNHRLGLFAISIWATWEGKNMPPLATKACWTSAMG